MSRRSWLRKLVVADLRRNGPAVHASGRAMQVLTDRVGHHSSMSVGNVVRELVAEGAAVRQTAKDGKAPRGLGGNASPHPRRTYRIELTEEYLATVPALGDVPTVGEAKQEQGPEEVAPDRQPYVATTTDAEPGEMELVDGVDYGLLSHAILKVVFNNLSASEEVVQLRATRRKLTTTHAALLETKAAVEDLRVELERERKQRVSAEREAKQLSLEVEALRAELRAERARGIDTRRAGHYELRDLASERSQAELVKLMRSMPTARG